VYAYIQAETRKKGKQNATVPDFSQNKELFLLAVFCVVW
jgi:hypothetical protein